MKGRISLTVFSLLVLEMVRNGGPGRVRKEGGRISGERRKGGSRTYLVEDAQIVGIVIVSEVEDALTRVLPHPPQPLAPATCRGTVMCRLPRLALVIHLLSARLSSARRAHPLSLLVGMLPCLSCCLGRACTSSLVAILICHGCLLLVIPACP